MDMSDDRHDEVNEDNKGGGGMNDENGREGGPRTRREVERSVFRLGKCTGGVIADFSWATVIAVTEAENTKNSPH